MTTSNAAPTASRRAALAGSWRIMLSFADGRTVGAFGTYGADGTAVVLGPTAQGSPPGNKLPG